MKLLELQRALRHLRCSDMATSLEPRLLEAQTDRPAPLDFLGRLVGDELLRRQDRLLDRRIKQAGFRDAGKTLHMLDFEFNKKMNRRLVFKNLASRRFVTQHEDALFLGPPGAARAILPRPGPRAHSPGASRPLPRSLCPHRRADRRAAGGRAQGRRRLPHRRALLIIDDLGMRKLPATAADDLLDIIMRRYERASTLRTSNRPVEDWGSCSAILGDIAKERSVVAGPRSWSSHAPCIAARWGWNSPELWDPPALKECCQLWSAELRRAPVAYFSAARVFRASSLPWKSAGEPIAALRAFRAFA